MSIEEYAMPGGYAVPDYPQPTSQEDLLHRLKQHVSQWNLWRQEHPGIAPDLSGANLSGLNLYKADFSSVRLEGSNLSKSFLREADFRGANLAGVNLAGANLSRADLQGADLRKANLRGAILDEASLKQANLAGTDLHDVSMAGVNFIDTDLSGTVLDVPAERHIYKSIDTAEKVAALRDLLKDLEPAAGREMERTAPVPSGRPKPPASDDKLSGCTYTVWYATNRKPVDADDDSKGFTSQREKVGIVHYGKCDVHIPESHKIGSLGAPWYKRLMSKKDRPLEIRDRLRLSELVYWETIRATLKELNPGERTALIFIHGFNVDFNEAVLRAAQLGADLKIPLTACYSWPAKGGWIHDYPADAAAVEAAEPYIKEFLMQFARQSQADSVNVIAHSMGNRALLRAVQQAGEEQTGTSFNQIFLAAPDIDCDTFSQTARAYCGIAKRTTLYCSGQDKALKVSGLLHQFPRAGLIPPITIIDGIDTIEVANVDFSMLGHGYYAAARNVLQDMNHLIYHNTHPGERFGLSPIQAANGTYWTFNA